MENLYIYTQNSAPNLIGIFTPGVLKRIVVFTNEPTSLLSSSRMSRTEQFLQAEEYITYDYFRILEAAHLKLVRFKLLCFDYSRVMVFKDKLLQNPLLREIKIFWPNSFPDHFDEINIQLGTFNQKDTQHPRWARFPYPPPNEGLVLEMAVFGDYIWFKGPEYIEGEMEKAEQQLNDLEFRHRRGNWVFDKIDDYTPAYPQDTDN